ncbi:type II secretion system protein [Shewanella sp. 10N.261.52.F9]|uniref:type II secretion system protein n=1 Tax=Shewanella sp. 10N.261.52.F9 TaxID=3229684 RepID=UPI0035545551
MKTTTNPKYSSATAGFTLIELVVVIIVLGILAVIAAPKFINLKSDANSAAIKGAVGSVKSAVSLFKSKTLTSGSSLTDVVTFSEITGSNHQPWAATATGTGFNAGYATPPEIFKAAGLDVNNWRYRIYVENGSYAVAGAPKSILDTAQPTAAEVKATNCYFNYHWQTAGTPSISSVDTGC